MNNIPNKIVIIDINGIIEYKNDKSNNCNIYPKIGENIKSYIYKNIIGYYNDDLWNRVKNGNIAEYETRVKINGKFINLTEINLFL